MGTTETHLMFHRRKLYTASDRISVQHILHAKYAVKA